MDMADLDYDGQGVFLTSRPNFELSDGGSHL